MTGQYKIALAMLSVMMVLGSAFVANGEDEGNATVQGWDTIVDPGKDCQIESTISITVPSTNHDLNPRRKLNAPRLLKRVSGDFVVQVKVSSDFQPGDTSTGAGKPFNGAGLLIWHDENSFLRLERNAYWAGDFLWCYPPLIEHWRDGKYRGVNATPALAEDFFKGRSTWLKLQRQSERMTASYSHDGEEWTVAKEFAVDFPEEVSVGIAALNTSNKPFSVVFEGFEIGVERP